MLNRIKNFDFNVTPTQDNKLKSAASDSMQSSDSESSADDKVQSINHEKGEAETKIFVGLRKKLLDELFSNGYMPNHSFSIDNRNFDFYDGMYYF